MAAAGAAAAGAPDAPAGGEAGGQGTWADAGRGPRPLKDTVAAVAGDVDALRKHVKAVSEVESSRRGRAIWQMPMRGRSVGGRDGVRHIN